MFADFLPHPLGRRAPASGPPPGNRYVAAVALPAAPADVLRLLADIEALPRWAPAFCERVDLRRGEWHALTTVGEAVCTLVADDSAGAVELRLLPEAGGGEIRLPFRIRARPGGGTIVTVTLVPGPGQPVAQFDRQRRSLERALLRLGTWFGNGSGPGRAPRPDLGWRRSIAAVTNRNRRPAI